MNNKITKTKKIRILLEINSINDGKIMTAKDFYLQLLFRYPELSKHFTSTIEIGKLLEQTTIEWLKQGLGAPKIYFCNKEAK